MQQFTDDYRDFTERVYDNSFRRAAHAIGGSYGLVVAQAHLDFSITGDFDGTHIYVRSDMDAETKLFILLHLFGHTVQFNHSPVMRAIGMAAHGPSTVNADILASIRVYEETAGRYALWLLRELGMLQFDQWLSDWTHGDWRYLHHLYTSGVREDLSLENINQYKRKWIKFGSELLVPLEIPSFVPRKWESRQSF